MKVRNKRPVKPYLLEVEDVDFSGCSIKNWTNNDKIKGNFSRGNKEIVA